MRSIYRCYSNIDNIIVEAVVIVIFLILFLLLDKNMVVYIKQNSFNFQLSCYFIKSSKVEIKFNNRRLIYNFYSLKSIVEL